MAIKLVIKNSINKLTNSKVFNQEKNFTKIEINKILKNLKSNKNSFSALNNNFKLGFKNSDLKKFKKYKQIAILGMGGSILGIKAIFNFFEHKIKKKFYFFDNLNELKIYDFNKKKNLNEILFIIVSKSGNTLETLTNFDVINKNKINKNNIIVITDNKKNNILNKLIKKYNPYCIEHKTYIGGRYSVLSEAGMLPSFLMGLNIKNFKKNIKKNLRKYIIKKLIDSVPQISHLYLSKKINSIILFNYCPELKNFTYWCQQLMAESLGKKGKGLLPVVSNAPKDHHSLLQLYLDGPKDKVFYIFSAKSKINLKLKNNFYSNKKLKFKDVIKAQKLSFIKVLKSKKIPYREIEINSFDEDTLSQLFTYFMLETALVGKIINVNPFDQPAVEEVKILTRKYLS
jgi:glucose-6-phosphate isomerase